MNSRRPRENDFSKRMEQKRSCRNFASYGHGDNLSGIRSANLGQIPHGPVAAASLLTPNT